MYKYLFLIFIYGASWCYVLAQYYHLTLKEWSFGKALAIALPLVLIEYTLALHGNKQASEFITPVQIITITIGFYVINLLILNLLVLKTPFDPIRDTLALILVIAAIAISQSK